METTAFSHATSIALAVKTSSNEHLASISSGGTFGWITNGDRLEVFNVSNGGRLSSMIFGVDKKKKCNTIITAALECPQSPYLIVATVTDDPYTPGSIICLFNARTSQIVKVITVPYEVTSLEFIGQSEIGQVALNKRMESFDGIVALGTYGGHIYLLDLKLSQSSQTSEKYPGSIVKDVDVTRLLQNNQHVAVWLGEVSKEHRTSDLHVSSMKYMKQASLLAVGLSNGYTELWDLVNLQLVYDSFVGEPRKGIMVNNFVFQEPENDPRNVCYLWVFYTPNVGSPKSIGEAFLLQMLFQNRIYDNECGFIYEDLLSAYLRFSHPLCSDLDKQFMAPSKLLSCSSFSSGVHDQSEDGSCQDIMVAVWQETEKRGAVKCYLLAFDLNKWYHCQMPPSIEAGHYMPTSEIIAMHRLDMLKKVKGIMNVKVEAKLVAENQDCNGVLPLLDFDITSISFSGLAFGKHQNVFMQMSNDIQKVQKVLFNKTKYYEMCYRLREFCHDNMTTIGFAETSEHFSLLSVIMDNGAVGIMASIVRQLACARVTGVESFLTLEHIVEWSKHKLQATKKTFDKLVVPLLEYGPAQLDKQSLNNFNKCKQSVQQLAAILSEVGAASDAVNDSVKPLLYSCLPLALHIEKFISACSWYLTADPACFCHGILIGGKLTNHLVEDYNSKRREYKGRKLAIDFVISEEGSSVRSHFKTLSGSPDYPPTNLETLLGLYLLPDVSIQSKHFISLYFLEDLLVDASEMTRSDMLATFASQLNISQSFIDLVRASWYNDHRQFKESYKILQSLQKDETLHSLFYPNLVRGFLDGKELESALNVSRKFLLPLENEEACCIYVEALALNGKIGEAYESLKASKFKDCFAKVMTKHGREDLLKEVLKTPMMSDERGRTYFQAFKSVIPVNIELFNESDLKVVKSQTTPWFRYRKPVTINDRKETNARNTQVSASKISEKEKSKKDVLLNDDHSLRSLYINLKPKVGSEEELDAYLEPRTFGPEEMALLNIPVSNKMSSPKGLFVNYSSILSKPRSTSSNSGDFLLSPKQLRFAEPGQNKFYIINDEPSEICPTLEEEEEVEEEQQEVTLEMNNSIQAGSQSSPCKLLEETTVEERINLTFELPTGSNVEVEEEEEEVDKVEEEIERPELVIELSEIEVEVQIDLNKALDDDQVSICTNEVSEAESYVTACSMDSLRRPALKRSRKSQDHAPSTPTRRSSRLSVHTNGMLPESDVEPQRRPSKRAKVGDAKLDLAVLSTLKEAREYDSKEDDVESVKSLPVMEDVMKTPIKSQSAGIQEPVSVRKSLRNSKRSRTDDESEEILKTPGKRKRVEEIKTPTKSDVTESLAVARTPRSARKIAKIVEEEEATEEKKKTESPSRKSSRKEKVAEEIKNHLSEKVVEEHLTPAQKAIRMKRLQKEQEAPKASLKPVKPKVLVESLQNTNSSDLPELKFSEPIIKEVARKATSPDLPNVSTFTFSPPQTRHRQRRTREEVKPVE